LRDEEVLLHVDEENSKNNNKKKTENQILILSENTSRVEKKLQFYY